MRIPILLVVLCTSLRVGAQQTPTIEGTDPAAEAVELPLKAELVLYPNPTSERLRVLWGDRSLVRMPVEIRGMDGRLVRLDSLSPVHELDVSDLEEGFYRLLLMDLSGVRAQATFRIEH